MLEQFTIDYYAPTNQRNVYVFLPDEALEHPDIRYNVLYMFDGHNIFEDSEATYGKSWGMKDYLEFMEIPLIVVGLESNREPGNGRLEEYAPFDFSDKDFGDVSGCGHATMEFFVNKLKPLIDAHYPTMPEREHTFIGGSSMGGLMTLYALTDYNHIFSRGAALSPSLWTNPPEIMHLLESTYFPEDTVLYMDYGQNEFRNHRSMRKHFIKAQNILTRKHVLLTSRVVPHGEHNEATWEKQLPFIIETLLYDAW